MKLSMDAVMQIKQNLVSGDDIGLSVYGAIQLCDTIESLTAENEQLREYKNHIDNRHLDDVLKLQHENEQLRQERAVLRDFVLDLIRRFEETAPDNNGTRRLVVDRIFLIEARSAILDKVPEYHNPEDVKALKMAREALNSVVWECTSKELDIGESTFYITSDAMIAIDKALGVGE